MSITPIRPTRSRRRSRRCGRMPQGRLIIVFGAGGDRDQGKRPQMGAVAVAARRRGDRHRRQSAQRGSGRDPRDDPGRRAGRDRDRRPPRGDPRGDRRGRARTTSSCSPARATSRARSSATQVLAVRRRHRGAGVRRHEPALDRVRDRRRRPAARAHGDFDVAGVDLRFARGRRRRPVRRAEGRGDRRPSLPRSGLRRGRRGRGGQRADRRTRMCWSPTRSRALERARPRRRARAAARRSSASPARSARPGPRRRCSPRSTGRRRAAAHRSVKSYNNHTGVPLSLARMPRDADYRRVRDGHEPCRRARRADPRWSARTSPSSPRSRRRIREFFASEEAIADAKGEIFEGLEPGGTAIIPYDSPHRDRLIAAAEPHAGRDRDLRPGRGRRCPRRSMRCGAATAARWSPRSCASARLSFTRRAAGRALGGQRAGGAGGGRGGRRRSRAGRARARRARRAQGPRRSATGSRSTAARRC